MMIVQALALRMIYKIEGKEESALYLETFKSSPKNSVRAEALKILSFCKNEDFIEAINLGINDSYELIQRFSASYMLKTGDQSHVPYLIDKLLQSNKGKRVAYHLKDAVGMYDQNYCLLNLKNKSLKKAIC